MTRRKSMCAADRLAETMAGRSPDECWAWTGYVRPDGYGIAPTGKRSVGPGAHLLAHRYAYEQLVGPIPEGLDLDHLCRVHQCVNPKHLEPVTRQVNLLRGVGLTAQFAAKTHCKRGHPFSPENTRMARGARECRECRREHERNKYRQHRETLKVRSNQRYHAHADEINARRRAAHRARREAEKAAH